MRRSYKLQIALARAKNSRTKLRNAGNRSGADACDAMDAIRDLDHAVFLIERMLQRAYTHEKETAAKLREQMTESANAANG